MLQLVVMRERWRGGKHVIRKRSSFVQQPERLVVAVDAGGPDGRGGPVRRAGALVELGALNFEDCREVDISVGRRTEHTREVDVTFGLGDGAPGQVGLLGPGRDRLARLLLVVCLVARVQIGQVVVLVGWRRRRLLPYGLILDRDSRLALRVQPFNCCK